MVFIGLKYNRDMVGREQELFQQNLIEKMTENSNQRLDEERS